MLYNQSSNSSLKLRCVCVFQLYPLWLCPFWLPANPGFVHPKGNEGMMYIDIGAYGAPKVPGYKAVETTRKLEKFVRDHDGLACKYCFNPDKIENDYKRILL